MRSGDLYDILEGPHLDEKKWVVLAVPLPGGDVWHYAEPAAVIEVSGGTVTLDVAEFTIASGGADARRSQAPGGFRGKRRHPAER